MVQDTRRRYRARHILLEDFEDAEYVLEKLEGGEDFAKLARELSECDSAESGGELGVFRSGQMVAEFERAVHQLEEGEISLPVKSEFGYHIIQRLKL